MDHPAGHDSRSPALSGAAAAKTPRVVSVGTKLAGATVALMLIVTAVVYKTLSDYQREHLLQAKQMAALAVTRLFADSCAAPIVFGDNGAINDALAHLGRSDDVPYAAVWSSDASGRAEVRLAELGSGTGVEVGAIPPAVELQRQPDRLVLLAPVHDLDGKLVGVGAVTFSLARENRLIADVRENTLFASGAIAAGLTLLLLLIARFAIVRPLGKLVIAANKIERGQASDIEVHSRDEIGQLAAAFRSMSRAITSREEHIRARNRDMRLVLDNVGQGFLTLDAKAQLSEERSRVVHDWFGVPEPGERFWEYIGRADAKAGERFEVGWTLISDDFMPLELSLDQLPRLIHTDARVLELAYRPILDGDQLQQLLVVITDVSERIEREGALVLERETMCVFQHILSDRGAFDDFFDEATALVASIQSSDGSDTAGLARVVHTLKGTSAIYGLESIADFCHALETELEGGGARVSERRKHELSGLWARVAGVRSQFSVEAGITVQREEHQALLSALSGRAPAELVLRLDSWQFEPASRRLALMGKQLQKLAHRLGKGDVQVRLAPTDLRLPPKRWAPLWAALSHILRNTVDHGLELPDERASLGKPLQATVTLSLSRDGQEVLLTIGDDGRGIDWAVIAERGRALGLSIDTPRELEAVLFTQGISSRVEVTATSGRGVGLSAVYEVVTSLGGRIAVHSERGKGTTFCFHLPESMLHEEGSRGHGSTASAEPRSESRRAATA